MGGGRWGRRLQLCVTDAEWDCWEPSCSEPTVVGPLHFQGFFCDSVTFDVSH